jgi:hypothetical protein
MSLPRSDSPESISTILTCRSEEYQECFSNESLLTEDLSDDALYNIIPLNTARLLGAKKNYRLDKLLYTMVKDAPHPSGQRYIAVCLHIAHQKGEDGVVNAAKAWLDHLLLPMLATSKAIRTDPSSSQTPTIADTLAHIESASPNDQHVLRAKVAHREEYYCAITKYFDFNRAVQLGKENRIGEIPAQPIQRMEAVHIIPLQFNHKLKITSPDIKDAACTLDMLQAWTRIDFEALVGQKTNSPTNTIYMTKNEHLKFEKFELYLDKDAYPDTPNKYKARMTRPYLLLEVDVLFRTLEESSVEPPNPQYLKVHAAFAKVLHICGAADVQFVERDDETEGTLCLNGGTDIGSSFGSRITVSILFYFYFTKGLLDFVSSFFGACLDSVSRLDTSK